VSRRHPLLIACILFLVLARPVMANVIGPSAGFFPGFLPLALWLALPASVLAAFLERPFVSRAGVRNHALWYSLQANLVSLAVGYLTLPVAIEMIYLNPFLWSPVAVAASIWCEGTYYRLRGLKGTRPLRWRPVIWGNVVSSLVLLFLPGIAAWLRQADSSLTWRLAPYEAGLLWGGVAGSIALFAVSFLVPILRPPAGVPTEASPPGGEHPC
jgi:hypothetical protein